MTEKKSLRQIVDEMREAINSAINDFKQKSVALQQMAENSSFEVRTMDYYLGAADYVDRGIVEIEKISEHLPALEALLEEETMKLQEVIKEMGDDKKIIDTILSDVYNGDEGEYGKNQGKDDFIEKYLPKIKAIHSLTDSIQQGESKTDQPPSSDTGSGGGENGMLERLVNSHFSMFRRLVQINNKEPQSEATQKAITEAAEINRYFSDKSSPRIVRS